MSHVHRLKEQPFHSLPATVTRLTKDWQGEAPAFGHRDLSGTDDVYVWLDGTHLKVLLAQDP